MSRPLIAYPETFAALGRFIAKRKMRDVCVMEFEGGMIVTGTVFYEKGEALGRSSETQVLSFADLQRLVKEH